MYVKIIADSINEQGDRLTTIEAEYPLYVHAQVMTHRVFSRNAQSSRAVPTKRLLEIVENKPIDIAFAKNQAGMEAGELLTGGDLQNAIRYWYRAKKVACYVASSLSSMGVHKQWVNRLLMPFMDIKVIISATEFENFFKLRLEHDAQPEIQQLAIFIKAAMFESTPKLLKAGEWHLPYVTDEERAITRDIEDLRAISAARCSRVSYLNHDKSQPSMTVDITHAINLYDNGHLSPFEHQATPVAKFKDDNSKWEQGVTHMTKDLTLWSANFKGFVQSRILGF